jgi:hypothetical protein
VPNHPRWPLIIYRHVLTFPARMDQAAMIDSKPDPHYPGRMSFPRRSSAAWRRCRHLGREVGSSRLSGRVFPRRAIRRCIHDRLRFRISP